MEVIILEAKGKFDFDIKMKKRLKMGYKPCYETFKITIIGNWLIGYHIYYTMLFQKE